jgi:hypothetical protein
VSKLDPQTRHLVDQHSEHIAELLTLFGIDRRDPVAMRGAFAATQALACIFHESSGQDRDSLLRGFLLCLQEMQP